MADKYNSINPIGTVGAALAGLAVGAAAVALSNEKKRKAIIDKAVDVKDGLAQSAEDVKDKVKEAVTEMTGMAADARDEVLDKKEKVKVAVKKKV